jgi:hypothetical protein
MRPTSPRTAQYARLEDGMLGVPARAARRLGWPRLAVDAVVLIGLIYVFMPAGSMTGIQSPGWAAANPYDPLVPVRLSPRW